MIPDGVNSATWVKGYAPVLERKKFSRGARDRNVALASIVARNPLARTKKGSKGDVER